MMHVAVTGYRHQFIDTHRARLMIRPRSLRSRSIVIVFGALLGVGDQPAFSCAFRPDCRTRMAGNRPSAFWPLRTCNTSGEELTIWLRPKSNRPEKRADWRVAGWRKPRRHRSRRQLRLQPRDRLTWKTSPS